MSAQVSARRSISRVSVSSIPASGASSASRSEGSTVILRYLPPVLVASLRRLRAGSVGMTMAPSSSLMKPPSGRGIGAPSGVPTPKTLRRAPLSASVLRIASASFSSRPSVTSRMRPESTPAESRSLSADATAAAGSLPGSGIMPGSSAGRRLAMVGWSSVSGVTTWASPAKATSAVWPSRRMSSRSSNLRRARSMREGRVSSAHME